MSKLYSDPLLVLVPAILIASCASLRDAHDGEKSIIVAGEYPPATNLNRADRKDETSHRSPEAGDVLLAYFDVEEKTYILHPSRHLRVDGKASAPQ